MMIMKIFDKGLSAALLLTLGLFAALSVAAMDVGDAKARGLVGETASGYVAAVSDSPEIAALVQSINEKRRERYKQIAKSNGISLEAVEVRAGQKAISRTPAGQYVDTGSGWQKK